MNLKTQTKEVDYKLESKSRSIQLLSLLLLFIGFNSCASGVVYKPNPFVVEKSKESQPNWIKYAEKQFVSENESQTILIKRNDIKDIKLGLMQLKNSSIIAAKMILSERLSGEINQQLGYLDTKNMLRIQRVVNEEIENFSGDLFTIKDIYFEKIVLNLDTANKNWNYIAYVLLSLNASDRQSIRKNVNIKILKQNNEHLVIK